MQYKQTLKTQKMRFTLDIRNNDLTTDELMVKVSQGFTRLRDREDNEPTPTNTELFVNGEEWMFITNSNTEWIGIRKIWEK